MRVALFAAGGEIATHALRTLVRDRDVVVIIRPAAPTGPAQAARAFARRLLRGRRPPDDLSQLAAEFGIAELRLPTHHDAALAARLSSTTDVAVVATYPRVLPAAIIDAPRLGTVNLHGSLLPRHRGPNPWFWVYHSDDREVGVTAHVCVPRVDRGAILACAAWPLARGLPVETLHHEVAERGAALLPDLLSALDRGNATSVPQDEALATKASRVPAGTPMVDPRWPAERTWHFLSGLVGQYREPLRCGGRPVVYRRVPGFETGPALGAPGLVEVGSSDRHWKLWCADGFVRLEGDV